jgi:hypothetical protein
MLTPSSPFAAKIYENSDSISNNLNPKYALENLFRVETTTKQIVKLTYLNSP